ncbi:hypothetical protein COCON_G00145870 [Conger conger]|uniref:Ankyrin repeat and SOCS box containing 8 n=1 Tax=Conger conger TaxID=82655 RepID=A0A9Q1HWD6_CONCO|nr:hypothetical protein COCON_G00145870 [Conger conger]
MSELKACWYQNLGCRLMCTGLIGLGSRIGVVDISQREGILNGLPENSDWQTPQYLPSVFVVDIPRKRSYRLKPWGVRRCLGLRFRSLLVVSVRPADTQARVRLIRTIAFIRSFPHDNVEDLIRRGADVNRMHGTLKPLHCACMVADADCVELLLEKGAEVNAVDGYNRTALHYAAEKDEGCVELLLEYGALPDALDGNKDTPLHWAAFKDNPECARALLEGGAQPDARDYNRDTPLSWAAMKGNLESVRVLLDFGAQARVSNLKGQTPVSRLAALLARGLGGEREEECLRLLCRAAGTPAPPELARDPRCWAAARPHCARWPAAPSAPAWAPASSPPPSRSCHCPNPCRSTSC